MHGMQAAHALGTFCNLSPAQDGPLSFLDRLLEEDCSCPSCPSRELFVFLFFVCSWVALGKAQQLALGSLDLAVVSTTTWH